jgi:HNH endonuclease
MSNTPTPPGDPNNSNSTRLFSKISLSENDLGCWEFTGYLDPKGYGRFYYDGRCHGAHRVAYVLAYGPIPPGLVVDHTCSNPSCVRYEHLQVVTVAENNRLAAERRTHCKNGHPWDERNTYWHKEGKRNCRRCNAEAVRRYSARKAAREDDSMA